MAHSKEELEELKSLAAKARDAHDPDSLAWTMHNAIYEKVSRLLDNLAPTTLH